MSECRVRVAMYLPAFGGSGSIGSIFVPAPGDEVSHRGGGRLWQQVQRRALTL